MSPKIIKSRISIIMNVRDFLFILLAGNKKWYNILSNKFFRRVEK